MSDRGGEPVAVLVPRENVNDESATVLAWPAADGSRVEAGQCVAQVETSKAVVDVAAPASGTLRHAARAGEDVAVGGVIGWIGDVTQGSSPPSSPRNGDAAHGVDPLPLSPSVRRLVAEENIDTAGSRGPGGGVGSPRPTCSTTWRRPPRRALDRCRPGSARTPGNSSVLSVWTSAISRAADWSARATSDRRRLRRLPRPFQPHRGRGSVAAVGVPVHSEPLSRAKRTEARYLRSGFESTLASVVTVACPTRGLREAARRFPAVGGNATALIVFEAARLLKIYPTLNAYHADGCVHYYGEVNVGFAVDAGRGLKVPVVREADRKEVSQVADEMRELVVSYLDDTLSVAALAGGTFTVTDLSGEGVSAFHPLINQGQSAILGVCAEVFPAGGREGTFNLVLAFDHQLSEGRTAARFLGELRDRLTHYEAAVPGGLGGEAAEPRCSRCQAGFRELAANGHALVQTAGADGAARWLCKLCFEGWV